MLAFGFREEGELFHTLELMQEQLGGGTPEKAVEMKTEGRGSDW
jgi:hypothetical protein